MFFPCRYIALEDPLSIMRWLCTFVLCVGLAVSKNPEENEGIHDPDLYEGDMILTAQQRMAAELGLDVDAPFGRASIKNKRWPKGVMAYVIDSTLLINSRAMNAIKAGMQEWTSKTCIRFKPRTNESAYAIFRIGKGCSSHVGRMGRSQNINLARGCWYKGIVAHEIGHALGFYHEQSRPDRDEYVTILWQNIEERAKHNFNKYGRQTIDSLGTKYDYGSVMHYGSKAFSKNKQPTIVAKQTGVAFGQRKGISITDAKQMNLLYSRCTDNGGSGGGGGGSCKDNPRYAKNCTFWKTRYCKSKRYESFMRANCSKSCGFCQ